MSRFPKTNVSPEELAKLKAKQKVFKDAEKKKKEELRKQKENK